MAPVVESLQGIRVEERAEREQEEQGGDDCQVNVEGLGAPCVGGAPELYPEEQGQAKTEEQRVGAAGRLLVVRAIGQRAAGEEGKGEPPHRALRELPATMDRAVQPAKPAEIDGNTEEHHPLDIG